MISYYKKQEYLRQIDKLIKSIELAQLDGFNLQVLKAQALQLKQRVESENDITLEESDTNLKLEELNTAIVIEIDEIKSKVPEKYYKMTDLENELPDWAKNIIAINPANETKCIRVLAALQSGEYEIVKDNIELFRYFPEETREKHEELCKYMVATNPELLQYVPTDVMRKDPNYWQTYFSYYHINGELFLQYDEKIRKNLKKEIKQYLQITEEEKKEKLNAIPESQYSMQQDCFKRGDLYKQQKREKNVKSGIKRYESDELMLCAVPEQVIMDNPEWTFNQIKEHGITKIEELPRRFVLKYKDWFMQNASEACLGYLPDQLKLENPEWAIGIEEKGWNWNRMKAITKDGRAQIYLEMIYNFPKELILASKYYDRDCFKYIREEYILRYCLGKIDLDALEYTFWQSPDQVKTPQQMSNIPVMKNIEQALSQLDDKAREKYSESATNLTVEYIRLMALKKRPDSPEMQKLIGDISTLEMELVDRTHEQQDFTRATNSYEQVFKEVEEKISQISQMNEELAQQYKNTLDQNRQKSILEIMRTGSLDQDGNKVLGSIDYYLRANKPKTQDTENSLITYKKPNFLMRFINQFRMANKGKIEESQKDDLELPEREGQERPQNDSSREMQEFDGMSLEELKTLMQQLEKEISSREESVLENPKEKEEKD